MKQSKLWPCKQKKKVHEESESKWKPNTCKFTSKLITLLSEFLGPAKATEVDSSTITFTPSTNGLDVNLQYNKGTALLAAFFPFTGHGMFSDLISGNFEVNQSYDLHMKSVLQILASNKKDGCYVEFPTGKDEPVTFHHNHLPSQVKVSPFDTADTDCGNPFIGVSGQSVNLIGDVLKSFDPDYKEVVHARFTEKFELDPASNVVQASESQKPPLCIKACLRSDTVTFSAMSGSKAIQWQQTYDIKPCSNEIEAKTEQNPVTDYTFRFSPIISGMFMSQLSAMSKHGFKTEMTLYQKNSENVLLGLQWYKVLDGDKLGKDDDERSKNGGTRGAGAARLGFMIGVYGASEA
jgi:hypothetical protein